MSDKENGGGEVSDSAPIYGRGRFPTLRKDENGKALCRGCGCVITDPRRQTWCSEKCHELFDPRYVRMTVIRRDKHVCQVCRLDIGEAVKRWRASRPQGKYTWDEFCKWSGSKPKEEYHHIVEFKDGGLTTLDNMITICVPCHRRLTAEYAKKRALLRKGGDLIEEGNQEGRLQG